MIGQTCRRQYRNVRMKLWTSVSGNCLYCHRRKERKKGNFKTRLGLLFQLSKSSESLKPYIYFLATTSPGNTIDFDTITSCRRKTRLLRSHDWSQFCICLGGASCLILSQNRTNPKYSCVTFDTQSNKMLFISTGQHFFGIQYYGECWGGEEADLSYDQYGSNPAGCYNNMVGKAWHNFVYKFNSEYKDILGPYSGLENDLRPLFFP